MDSSTIPEIKSTDEIYNQNLFYEKDLGTTIISVVYSGGVMLAADARTSSG